jgi:hypothetical protein
MKKLMTTLIMALLVSTLSFSVVAEEHALGTIQGTGIDLKSFDHAFAGSIDDFLVWGFLDEATFTSELIVRKYQQTIKTTFSRGESAIGGTIAYKLEEQDRSVAISVMGVDGEAQEIKLNINGEEVAVKISGEYVDGHFVDPTFTAVMGGRDISFKAEGEACYGLSMHYAMMILGALSI